MRHKIENPTYMTADEMEVTYDGKWVLVVNADFSPYKQFLGGTPVVVADNVYEGQADGFYDEYRDKKYAPRTYRDFVVSAPELLNAFFGILGGDDK